MTAIPVLIAALLVASAVGKAANRRQAERGIAEITRSADVAPAIVAASIVAEWLVAVVILLWPGSAVARGALIFLFALFAVLGGFALLTGRRIRCGCFGSLHAGARLGWWQVVQLLIVAPVTLLLFPGGWRPLVGLTAIFFVHLAVGAGFVVRAAPFWREVRVQRQSLGSARQIAQATSWEELARA
jgi:hypothetical protein